MDGYTSVFTSEICIHFPNSVPPEDKNVNKSAGADLSDRRGPEE